MPIYSCSRWQRQQSKKAQASVGIHCLGNNTKRYRLIHNNKEMGLVYKYSFIHNRGGRIQFG